MKTLTKQKIYLDNNSSTALDPKVLNVVIDNLKESAGNPSSTHSFGQKARHKLNNARQTIANSLSVKPNEIIFNSGGTEGANMIIRGLFPQGSFGHIIASSVEHSCVYATIKSLESKTITCTYLSPGRWGAIQPEDVRRAITPETRLIALMAVNNETGVKTDIQAIASIAQEANIPFFVDGVALLGKEPFQIPDGVSAMTFSGHKLHAPKGIGFAVIRNHLKLTPLLTGGHQEYNRRGGTENLSSIVGLAEAVKLLETELPTAYFRMQKLRDRLERKIMENLEGVTINGTAPRVVNTSNMSFDGVEGEVLLAQLDLQGIAVSHGSACSSGALEPSRILLNMGLSHQEAGSSLRFSLSRFTTEEEINNCIEVLINCVNKLRQF